MVRRARGSGRARCGQREPFARRGRAVPGDRRENRVVDLFDEVEEELRAERAQKLLQRYGGLIVAAAVLIIGAAAGWQGWQWWQAKQDRAAATEFVASMTAADSSLPAAAKARPATIATFDALAAKAPEGYRTLARLRAAALKAESGDLAGADVLWDQVAADSAADPLLRDLASLLWAQHQLDSGDPALIAARLKPLSEPGNAWRPLAQEQLALLDLRQGKTDAARTALRSLSRDVTAPSGVRGRAGALLGRLGG